MLGYYDSPGIADEKEVAELSAALLYQLVSNPYQTLADCTGYLDRKFRLEEGNALNPFFHLSARKIIPLRMEEKLLPTQPVRQLVNTAQLEDRLEKKEEDLYESNPA